jgi:uncharacterized protein
MAKNFAEIAFTDSVKLLQKKHGSRENYERVERTKVVNGLSNIEAEFIKNRDSFYLATIGAKNYPYIQHRGGPKGFLKILDSKRLGFIDFTGNRQYISVGNVSDNNNVALIMVDYAVQSRLKILAKAEIIGLTDNKELFEKLNLPEYKFRPERLMVFHIEAFDWNCPQHITPRYSLEEINDLFVPQREHIAKLESEIKALKEQIGK